ncbi:MAG: 30S ribosomal protein THX [Sediminicola sp.]|tara:strand:- start:121748 stop:121876 length:129 start_codon:yes stop_codon:yes gene_type:complete
MGKGDIKTKRGKIGNKSYGARRKRKIKRKPTIEERIQVEKKK